MRVAIVNNEASADQNLRIAPLVLSLPLNRYNGQGGFHWQRVGHIFVEVFYSKYIRVKRFGET